MYGLANALDPRSICAQFYPNKRLLCFETFIKLHIGLQETGSFTKSRDTIKRLKNAKISLLADEILEIIDKHPETSTAIIAQQVNVSPKSV